MVISSKDFINSYESILKDGAQFGINISYKVQDEPKGTEAFIIAKTLFQMMIMLWCWEIIFIMVEILEILQEHLKKFGATVFATSK